MKITNKNTFSANKIKVSSFGLKLFVINQSGQEVARAFLYIMHNDLHERSFALLEDVFVKESERGKGYGKKIIIQAIEEAKSQDCYKLIATSRYQRAAVHQMYLKLGFKDWGHEFRLEF